MIDLIVFNVGGNRYALNIENVQRIIQSQELTQIPNAHALIDGMMSHEEKVIKTLNFRKLIGMDSYDDELETLFARLKVAHKDWVDALQHSIEHGSTFTKTTDPHKCDLGKWIDNFNSYDDDVSATLKDLTESHKRLHVTGGELLEVYAEEPEKALERFRSEIHDIYSHTMGDLEHFTEDLGRVADSLQKLVIYEKDTKIFAIKVDIIEDIAHIEESDIMNSDEHEASEYLELQGVLDIDGALINVIKTIDIPT